MSENMVTRNIQQTLHQLPLIVLVISVVLINILEDLTLQQPVLTRHRQNRHFTNELIHFCEELFSKKPLLISPKLNTLNFKKPEKSKYQPENRAEVIQGIDICLP